jgi:signal transduction histidine kinase
MGILEVVKATQGLAEFTEEDKSEFARHIFDTVREPLLALSADLSVWLANKSFYRTFKVSPEHTQGRRIYDLGNGQWNIPRLRELLEEIVPHDESFDDFEVDHDFESIGRKQMLLNARKINGGRLILLAIEDVTERRRMEDELRNFAHLASHDLREPVRMVTSYLALLEQQADKNGSNSAEYIGFAIDGARRMSALISNLLKHASIGRQTNFGPVDMNVALRNVLADLKVSLSEEGAQVTYGELPTVRGDSTEAEQLLQNLISNAIKYRSKDSPRAHISALRKGAEWLFKVEDNGLGIAPKDQKRIFNAFERLHSRNEYPGSGLGLATCKKIVEGHGGRIWVESEEGHGSVFFFTLPAVENRSAD